jgi:hypothetical protein
MVGIYLPLHTQAFVLPQAKTVQSQWITITETMVDSGSTIPKQKNVLFHLPFDINDIELNILFGRKSENIRFWGFCYPDDFNPGLAAKNGFPGKLFLSKAERKWRADQEAANKKIANIFNPPSRKGGKATAISVKHQLDIFPPGASCYIMTNEPLSIGTDRDEDYLNSKIESEKGTDPDNPDSDEDGILDGLEVQYGTNPVIRDTDSDGIPDGIEDANQNGRLDYGETDALKRDTDDDNLCDGMCSVRGAKRICDDQNICIDLPYTRLTGEDKNLDGVVDENETDPRLKDTDGDGVQDYKPQGTG